MINRFFRIFFPFFLLLFLFSCKNNIPQDKSRYILWKNDFKGNQNVIVEELESIIPFSQKENSKPLGIPITPRVWWYNFGKEIFNPSKTESKLNALKEKVSKNEETPSFPSRKFRKYERKIKILEENLAEQNSWFWRNIGEKQVYIDYNEVNRTTSKINKFLIDIGYRDAQVVSKLDTLGNTQKVKVTYQIIENQPYVVDSVKYETTDPRIDSVITSNLKASIIKKGNLFDLRLVQSEKIRIELLLKNNGFFNFSNKYINHGATNKEADENLFKAEKKGILIFDILNPGPVQHEKFIIDEVVFKAFDPNATSLALIRPDTVFFNNVKFIRIDRTIPLEIISERIITKPGNLFNQSEIQETQRQIAYFNQFAFASSQVKPIASGLLSLEYFAPLLQKYSFGISPGINNIYNDGSTFFGFGVPVSITARNRFRKLETIEAQVRASYEGQPSPIITNDKAIRGSLELGVNLNTTLPNVFPFNKISDQISLKNPRTILSLGYNYSEPFWGKRTNFKLNTNYSLQLNKNSTFYLSLLDVSLINTVYFNNDAGKAFYQSLVTLQQEQGNNLKVTFDPQFVSSINTNLIFNDQIPGKPFSNSRFFRIFLESGGTILNFLQNKEQLGFIEKIFPLNTSENSIDTVRQYFRFIKINLDYRRNISLGEKSSLAYRINTGLINPYGKNRSLPFEKNFFIGGSNSVRAWAPRTLGVGSAGADTTTAGNTIPQPGDIILEGSLEYRLKLFHFAGDIQLATFIDAGNVWKWHQNYSVTKYNKTNFDINRFYKEIGVGTGFGIRWDLSYFLFRFDWGIKVIDPARPIGQRYVLDEFSLGKNSAYGLNWNFGIGYPF